MVREQSLESWLSQVVESFGCRWFGKLGGHHASSLFPPLRARVELGAPQQFCGLHRRFAELMTLSRFAIVGSGVRYSCRSCEAAVRRCEGLSCCASLIWSVARRYPCSRARRPIISSSQPRTSQKREIVDMQMREHTRRVQILSVFTYSLSSRCEGSQAHLIRMTR